MKLLRIYFTLIFTWMSFASIEAQVAKTQVLNLFVNPTSNGFDINWPENTSRTGTYSVFYRDLFKEGAQWTSAGSSLKGPASKYNITTSNNLEVLVQYLNTSNQLESLGYIAASKNLDHFVAKGRTILLVDSMISASLKNEIDTLKSDLIASGWFYEEIIVTKSEKPDAIKSKINKILKDKTFETNCLYILGHVPVPYSGYFSSTGSRPPPDGHVEGSGNHTGAWPADVFYGDHEGIWEDLLVKCTTGSQTRHHNVGGDGKFDPSEIPGIVSLDIGRVDFNDMPAFVESEIELTREYLNRTHRWKHASIPFVKRALIDNNFGNLNLASTGYQNFSCFISQDSIFDNRDYFTAQSNGNYLWSYGCGAGSYTSCNGIGNTNNFASYKKKDSFHNIFTVLAGSYFGDWDSRNNLLRASLAAGSLATFWGGIPKWYVHHMGVGKHIGMGARITQNNNNEYFNGGFNASHKGVHIALLGDPTLEMLPIKPVSDLSAKSENGKVELRWKPSADAEFYEIYRIDFENQQYIPVNSAGDCKSTVTDTVFYDECNWTSGNYTYGVAALKITSTPSGSYQNKSLMKFTTVDHTNNNQQVEFQNLEIYPNPTFGVLKIKANSPINGNLKVFNSIGQQVFTMNNINSLESIDVSFLNEGIYLIRFNEVNSTESVSSWISIIK